MPEVNFEKADGLGIGIRVNVRLLYPLDLFILNMVIFIKISNRNCPRKWVLPLLSTFQNLILLIQPVLLLTPRLRLIKHEKLRHSIFTCFLKYETIVHWLPQFNMYNKSVLARVSMCQKVILWLEKVKPWILAFCWIVRQVSFDFWTNFTYFGQSV